MHACCVLAAPVWRTMAPLLLITTLVTSYLHSAAGQSSCTTANGKRGECVSLQDCSSLQPSPAHSTCGFDKATHLVCCPVNPCTTPEGTEGNCIGLYSCPRLMDMLKPGPSLAAIQYVEDSKCEGPEPNSVCCGPSLNSNVNSGKHTEAAAGTCQLTALPPDPSGDCCGLESNGGGNRIVGGNVTAIDEYPWMGIIEYKKSDKIKLLCGAALISGRYVVTAAHCVLGPVLDSGTPVSVRLGEYDTSNPGVDCVSTPGGGEDCNEGALSVPIEQITAHPEYSSTAPLRRHDIALIRLERIAPFTDFIRPICLPTADVASTSSSENLMLHVAGWGAVAENKFSSNIKLKVSLPYLSYQECQPSYNVRGRRVRLWEGQMCAGGVLGKDSCRGDSGGPLMREDNRRYELVGVVSFGPSPCGLENAPGVYTKVFHYLPWIRSVIVA